MSKWVLIVEDEKATAWALAESLREDGLETEVAHSRAAASEAWRRRRYDLVITDIRLPDGNGLDFLDVLRVAPDAPPAIVISAFGGSDVETAVARAGAQAYFQKPFDVQSLMSAVTALLVPAPPTVQVPSRKV